jgi:hypothetical protein
MIDLTITLTVDEAKFLLHAGERDVAQNLATAQRTVLDRLAAKIEEAEKEESAYNATLQGETHWAREQPYEGPSRYADPLAP